jgi:hypothetical protein
MTMPKLTGTNIVGSAKEKDTARTIGTIHIFLAIKATAENCLYQAPLLWDSPHVSRRVAAQRSHFMIFGREPEWLSNLLGIRGSRLRAIDIPKESIHAIKYELRDAGLTESVIFPDLDGLGREIEQKWMDRL